MSRRDIISAKQLPIQKKKGCWSCYLSTYQRRRIIAYSCNLITLSATVNPGFIEKGMFECEISLLNKVSLHQFLQG